MRLRETLSHGAIAGNDAPEPSWAEMEIAISMACNDDS